MWDSKSSPQQLPPVLIVDDDEDDLFFLRRKVTASGVKNPILAFRHPVELIRFLRGEQTPGNAASEVKPCLIFCDIKMPEMTGFEVLQWIRTQPHLHTVSVVMVSGSSLEADRTCAAQLGANGYLVKFPEPSVLGDCVSDAMKKQWASL